MNVELVEWTVPNYITGKMPSRPRQEDWNPDAVPKWALHEVDEETLAEQCDKFRSSVFEKASKIDPYESKKKSINI